jgi:hypothetical protein
MKKKISLTVVLLTGFFVFLYAQDTKVTVDNLAAYSKKDTIEGWKHSGLSGITFGQTSLHNWVAGGDNTLSGDFFLNATANYLKNRWFWDNNLSLEYGMIYSSTNDWQKSSDKIKFTSVAGRQISNHWSFSTLLSFNTQFGKGYNYPNITHYISTFMAPAYADAALGISYKPNKKYSFFISPVAERATFVLNDSLSNAGAFGIKPGEKVNWETGAYLMASSNQTITTNLNLISSLDMFTPYNENFGNMNINWTLLLSYKINKLFTATLNTTLRYYDSEIQKIQFKEIIGLGLTYNF